MKFPADTAGRGTRCVSAKNPFTAELHAESLYLRVNYVYVCMKVS